MEEDIEEIAAKPVYGTWGISMKNGEYHEITAYSGSNRDGFFVLQDHNWRDIAEFNRTLVSAIFHGKTHLLNQQASEGES